MVSQVRIEVDGLKELERKLKQIDTLTAWRKVMRPAKQKALRPVREAVKKRAAQFNKTNTQRLSQGRTPGALVKGVRMASRTPKRTDATTRAIFGPALGDVLVGVFFKKSRLGLFKNLQRDPDLYAKRPPFYVRFLEFGRRNGGALPQTDFIRREFDSRRNQTLDIYTKELRKRLDERAK